MIVSRGSHFSASDHTRTITFNFLLSLDEPYTYHFLLLQQASLLCE
jgi:hypothetical protein